MELLLLLLLLLLEGESPCLGVQFPSEAKDLVLVLLLHLGVVSLQFDQCLLELLHLLQLLSHCNYNHITKSV